MKSVSRFEVFVGSHRIFRHVRLALQLLHAIVYLCQISNAYRIWHSTGWLWHSIVSLQMCVVCFVWNEESALLSLIGTNKWVIWRVIVQITCSHWYQGFDIICTCSLKQVQINGACETNSLGSWSVHRLHLAQVSNKIFTAIMRGWMEKQHLRGSATQRDNPWRLEAAACWCLLWTELPLNPCILTNGRSP